MLHPEIHLLPDKNWNLEEMSEEDWYFLYSPLFQSGNEESLNTLDRNSRSNIPHDSILSFGKTILNYLGSSFVLVPFLVVWEDRLSWTATERDG